MGTIKFVLNLSIITLLLVKNFIVDIFACGTFLIYLFIFVCV